MGANEDEIEGIFSHEEALVPSSGFCASVMEAVRREAAVPAPIPFPWKRALPILILAGAAVVFVFVWVATTVTDARTASSSMSLNWTSMSATIPKWMANPTVGWAIGSLLLAFGSVRFSMRLASR